MLRCLTGLLVAVKTGLLMAAEYLRQPLYLLHCVRADLANGLPSLDFSSSVVRAAGFCGACTRFIRHKYYVLNCQLPCGALLSTVLCATVAPLLPQALSYAILQSQGPPGFKSKRGAAWQLTREANRAADAPKGADGCAALIPRSASALLQLAYFAYLRTCCPSRSEVLSQLTLTSHTTQYCWFSYRRSGRA